MITILRRRFARNIWVATFKVNVTTWPCSKIVSGPLLGYLKSDFKTILQKWPPSWDDVFCATFWSLPWRSRSQHDLAAKSCPAYNFVIWSLISKNISQKWSPYWYDVSRTTFETLPWRSRSQYELAAKSCWAHNFVIWSRISKIFHRRDHHIKKRWRAQLWAATLKVKVTAWPNSKFVSHNFVIWSRISHFFT